MYHWHRIFGDTHVTYKMLWYTKFIFVCQKFFAYQKKTFTVLLKLRSGFNPSFFGNTQVTHKNIFGDTHVIQKIFVVIYMIHNNNCLVVHANRNAWERKLTLTDSTTAGTRAFSGTERSAPTQLLGVGFWVQRCFGFIFLKIGDPGGSIPFHSRESGYPRGRGVPSWCQAGAQCAS